MTHNDISRVLVDSVEEFSNRFITETTYKPKKYRSDYYKKPEVNNLLANYAKATDLNTHTGDTTKHITSTERTNWNNTNTNFNDWFYKDSNGNIHSKYSFIGDSEISAYGAGSSSGSGGVTIYDGLDSTSKDVALSANQGRYLKSLIDNIDVGNVDLSNYYTKT